MTVLGELSAEVGDCAPDALVMSLSAVGCADRIELQCFDSSVAVSAPIISIEGGEAA